MAPERQLRILQILYIVFILACFWLVHYLPGNPSQKVSFLFEGLLVVCAVYSAAIGFWMQRWLARTGIRPGRPVSQSAPLQRWRAGHILRLATAVAVSLWGFVLHFSGGAFWLVDVLVGAGLVLLLIWRPGVSPKAT